MGGELEDEWVADKFLGSNDPVAETRTYRTINDVTITSGAQIKLEAVQNNEEWGRFDNIEITPGIATSLAPASPEIRPTDFYLSQNYPNPFNPETNIMYQLAETSRVKLEIFDVNGCRIRILVDGLQSDGYHTVRWNGMNEINQKVASGIYIYRITATGSKQRFLQNKKMLFLK